MLDALERSTTSHCKVLVVITKRQQRNGWIKMDKISIRRESRIGYALEEEGKEREREGDDKSSSAVYLSRLLTAI